MSNEINNLKSEKKNIIFNNKVEEDVPICYCEDKTQQSFECCNLTKDYVFKNNKKIIFFKILI